MNSLKSTIISGLFLYFVCINPVLSWNAVGHRLIAQIAYNNLSWRSKVTFNRYNRGLDTGYMSRSLVNSSVWLDSIRWKTHEYDAMHYIDLPFSTDGMRLPKIPLVNARTAIEQAIKTLTNPDTTAAKKGIALRILVHVVGDIHQPMHAVTRVSHDFPEGDRGGNLVRLHRNKVAKNLHAYWDKGAGLFTGKRQYGQAWIKQKAKAINTRWPCSSVEIDLNSMHWAEESNAIAKRYAYTLPINQDYQAHAQMLIEQRIALAGCRLAAVLNQVEN